MDKIYTSLLITIAVSIAIAAGSPVHSSGSSESKFYGHGNEYSVNLDNFHTPKRVSLVDNPAARLVSFAGQMKLKQRGNPIKERYTTKLKEAEVNEYQLKNSNDKVYHVKQNFNVDGKAKYKSNTYGYYESKTKTATIVDVSLYDIEKNYKI